MAAREIAVEVAYARPDVQLVLAVCVADGATLRDAIERSGILARCPEIDLVRQAVGVHGRVRPLDAKVRAGDRVEIYRALAADPKEQRRRRAHGATSA